MAQQQQQQPPCPTTPPQPYLLPTSAANPNHDRLTYTHLLLSPTIAPETLRLALHALAAQLIQRLQDLDLTVHGHSNLAVPHPERHLVCYLGAKDAGDAATAELVAKWREFAWTGEARRASAGCSLNVLRMLVVVCWGDLRRVRGWRRAGEGFWEDGHGHGHGHGEVEGVREAMTP
ncbi:hypothetical protein LTR36_004951 [Oleoguttula mirabilis]|uniref:Uncharacterized protein n=1 Tax=Oleoguttula mirabilis TaxID=1507867 RepID=A0AAV9JVP4_9PEZI|nr:hypothetical protein LTR36_004951 [Oleoguttula mirabilis]